MRVATKRVALLVLSLAVFSLAGCDLFDSSGDEESKGMLPSFVEGEYDARYVVHMANGDRFRGELFCVFFGEKEVWDCEPGLTGQLVTAGGPYEINNEELVLHDVNIKRSNFIWALSPDGPYDYELDEDTLTLTQEGADSPDYYARDYHRIVLVKRDSTEYLKALN